MPHNVAPAAKTGEADQAQVVERQSLSSGEPLWQAEIAISQGGVNHAGQLRTFTIRGPPRKAQEQADEDAKKLTEAVAEGPKAVRTLANQLHRAS